MSLLTKPKMTTRWRKLLLVIVSILLLAPSVGAAAFNMRFDLETIAQDQAQQEKEKELRKQRSEEEILKQKIEMSARERASTDEMKERIARDPQFAAEFAKRREFEMEMKAIRQAALIKLARINMDQAIQIATSQQPGKVLVASLDAKGWEEPGKLAKDGLVFYHVIIADEVNEGASHVWVNAVDGTIIKTEKELPRKQRKPENE